MDDNRRKLYDAISSEYDLPDYEQFSNDMQDDGKRQKLYNAISKEYDLPDFETFTNDIGIVKQPKQQAQVVDDFTVTESSLDATNDANEQGSQTTINGQAVQQPTQQTQQPAPVPQPQRQAGKVANVVKSDERNGVKLRYYVQGGKRIYNPDDVRKWQEQTQGTTDVQEQLPMGMTKFQWDRLPEDVREQYRKQMREQGKMQGAVLGAATSGTLPIEGMNVAKSAGEWEGAVGKLQKTENQNAFRASGGAQKQAERQAEIAKQQEAVDALPSALTSLKALEQRGVDANQSLQYNPETGKFENNASMVDVSVTDDDGNQYVVDEEGNIFNDKKELEDYKYRKAQENIEKAKYSRAIAEQDAYRNTHEAPKTEPNPEDFENPKDYEQAKAWWEEIAESLSYPTRLQDESEASYELRLKNYIQRKKADFERRLEEAHIDTSMSDATWGMQPYHMLNMDEFGGETKEAVRAEYSEWAENMRYMWPELMNSKWDDYGSTLLSPLTSLGRSMVEMVGNTAELLAGKNALSDIAHKAVDESHKREEERITTTRMSEIWKDYGDVIAYSPIGMTPFIIKGAGEQGYQARMNGSSAFGATVASASNGLIWGVVSRFLGSPVTNKVFNKIAKTQATRATEYMQNVLGGKDKVAAANLQKAMKDFIWQAEHTMQVALTKDMKNRLMSIAAGTFHSTLDMATASALCQFICLYDGEKIMKTDEQGNIVEAQGIGEKVSTAAKNALEGFKEGAVDGALFGLFFGAFGHGSQMWKDWRGLRGVTELTPEEVTKIGVAEPYSSEKDILIGQYPLNERENGVAIIIGKSKNAGMMKCMLGNGMYVDVPANAFTLVKTMSKESFNQHLNAAVDEYYTGELNDMPATDSRIAQSKERFINARNKLNESLQSNDWGDEERAVLIDAMRGGYKTLGQAIKDGKFSDSHASIVEEMQQSMREYDERLNGARRRVNEQLNAYEAEIDAISHKEENGKPAEDIVECEILKGAREGEEPKRGYILSGEYANDESPILVQIEGEAKPVMLQGMDVKVGEVRKINELVAQKRAELEQREASIIDGDVTNYLQEGADEFPVMIDGEVRYAKFVGMSPEGEYVLRLTSGEQIAEPREEIQQQYFNAVRRYAKTFEMDERGNIKGVTAFTDAEMADKTSGIVEEKPAEEVKQEPIATEEKPTEQVATEPIAPEEPIAAEKLIEDRAEGFERGDTFRIERDGEQVRMMIDDVYEENGKKTYRVRIETPDGEVRSEDYTEQDLSALVYGKEEEDAMPMTEEGKPDYLAATPERTAQYIYGERNLEAEEADALVENNRASAEDEYNKLLKDKPQVGTDIDEYEAQKAEWQAKVDEAKARADYWKQVQDARTRQKINEAIAEEQAKQVGETAEEASREKTGANESAAPTASDSFNMEAYETEEERLEKEGGLKVNEVSQRALSDGSAKLLDAFGKTIGKKIVVLSEAEVDAIWKGKGKSARGVTSSDGKTIYLNERFIRGKKDVLASVSGHEMTHMLKKVLGADSNEWKSFVDAVKQAMGKEFDKQFKELRSLYDEGFKEMNKSLPEGKQFKLLDDDGITEEVVAKWVGNKLLTNEEAIRSVIKTAESTGEATTLIQKVLDWINGQIDRLKKLAKTATMSEEEAAQYESFVKAKELWQKMYNEAAEKNTEAKIGKERFDLVEKNYENAVKDGDTEKAQEMVENAARMAGYTIKAYHGTGRADRVGNVFRPERATSGPMAFFTDNKEIAESYAKGKQDTSIAYDTDYDSYETQFRTKVKSTGKDYSVYDVWGFLPMSKRAEIAEKAKHVRRDWEGDGDIIYDTETTDANGGWDWQVKINKGNILRALNEQWLLSGNLFNKEDKYLKVLELAGVTDALKEEGFEAPRYMNPNYREEAVYDVYLKIQKPFDVSSMVNEKFIKGFEKFAKKHESEYASEYANADMWDKNNVSAEDFAARMREDLEKGESFAWTSIPDVMTAYLKSLGYDGIKDTGGKNGGDIHTVWIPFSSEQIKRSDAATYDDAGNLIPLSDRFNEGSNDIRFDFVENIAAIDNAINNAYSPMKKEEAEEWVEYAKKNAIAERVVEYSKENFIKDFPNMIVKTPLGLIKLGENQFEKLEDKKRQNDWGMMKPTLESPDIVFLEKDKPSNKKYERDSKLLFVKTFIRNGESIVHFESATIRKEGLEISVSSHIIQPDELIGKLTQDKIVYNKRESDNGSEWHLTKDSNSLPDLVPTQSDNLSVANIEQTTETAKENAENFAEKDKILSTPTTIEEKEESYFNDQDSFSLVEDKKLKDDLEKGDKVKVYRAMQLVDGNLYPPMAGKVNGEWQNPIQLGVWEKADEHPELVNKDGKFKLDKGNGKYIWAAYNPYLHTSRSPLNDQFSSAWSRPELVTVEVEVPASELTSGYRADKAKDTVGETDWKSGSVSGKLAKNGNPRKVILSRYDKPIRIVPNEEVAQRIAEMLDGTGLKIPFNTVTPELREALIAHGVKIGKPEKGNAGAASREAYNAFRGNQDMFDLAGEPKPTFYSNAAKAVEDIKQEKATPEQWLKMIEKNGGLKAGEDKWMGLSDFLKNSDAKTLTKQEVLDFIRENQVVVEDVTYMEQKDLYKTSKFKEFNDEFQDLIARKDEMWQEADNAYAAFMEEMKEKYGDDWQDKMPSYEFAREEDLLEQRERWTNEPEEAAFKYMVDEYGDDFEMAFWHEFGELNVGDEEAASYFVAGSEGIIDQTRLDYTTQGLENKREIALVVPTIESWAVDDKVHFGDAGEGRAIAWIRFGETKANTGVKEYKEALDNLSAYKGEMEKKYGTLDYESVISPEEKAELKRLDDEVARTAKDAKTNRVLVIDEIQSKRHQEGREQGYSKPEDYTAKQAEGGEWQIFKDGEMVGVTPSWQAKTPDEAVDYYAIKMGNVVLDAPFEKNWMELAMKRMLRYAAENSYDKIAWTKGDQQASRYNLGGSVKFIESIYNPSSGNKDIFIRFLNDNQLELEVNKDGVVEFSNRVGIVEDGQKLSDVVGKDIANRILTAEEPELKIEGEDLSVGGEGMKGFYDYMLPKFMDKYGKKWGVKTGEVELPSLEAPAQTMWSVDVTPEMKASVMEGQPMFSLAKPKVDTEPKDVTEVAAEQLSRGRVLWENDERGEAVRKGMKAETGYGEGERRKLFGLFAGVNKGGRSIDEIAHAVWEECKDRGIPCESDEQAKQAVMDVLQSAETFKDIRNFIKNRRYDEADEMAKHEMDAYQAERDQHFMDEYGMTEDEYESYLRQSSQEMVEGSEEDKKKIEQLTGEKAKLEERLEKEKAKNELGSPLVAFLNDQITKFKNEIDRIKQEGDERREELSNQLSTLDAVKKDLVEFIEKQYNAAWMPYMGKNDLNRLLKTVRDAKTAEQLEEAQTKVQDIAANGAVRFMQSKIEKLLKLPKVGKNTRGMAVAKNVDARTRKIFDNLFKSIADSKVTGMEEAMDELRKKRRETRQQISYYERLDGDYSAELESLNKELEDVNEQMRNMKLLIEDTRHHKDGSTPFDTTEAWEDINTRLSESSEGKREWTDRDTDEYIELCVKDIMSDAQKASNEAYRLKNEIDKLYTEIEESNERARAEGTRRTKSYRDYLDDMFAQIKEKQQLMASAKMEQAQKLADVEKTLSELYAGGHNSLKYKVEQQIQHKHDILRKAFADIKGKPYDTTIDKRELEKNAKANWVRELGDVLHSFEYECQDVSAKTRGREGFLYQYFIKGDDGAMSSWNNYLKGLREQKETLDAKVREIFGENFGIFDKAKVKLSGEWAVLAENSSDIVDESGVFIKRNEQDVQLPMSKGTAMYAYMAWKMKDGRVKMERQGFSEESMAQIEDFIGEPYKQLADWIQEEFLPATREKYNGRYMEMYNTSMANIENYVPLKINKAVLDEKNDNEGAKGGAYGSSNLDKKSKSLIERKFNTKEIDVFSNAFDVISEHVDDMEEWYAYVKFRRDLDTILNSQHFRNQLNMNKAGSYDAFRKSAAVATLNERREEIGGTEELLGNATKNLVATNIAYRLNTALKQTLSAPAYLAYSADPRFIMHFGKNVGKTVMWNNLKWCYDNLESFRKRVQMGDIGDNRLSEKMVADDGTWLSYVKKWQDIADNVNAIGMIPNRLVDAITCAVGIRSIYDFEMGKAESYVKKAKLEDAEKKAYLEEARKKALMEADIFYNKTQQSSHPAFISDTQKSRGILNRSLTAYQNANIAYTRMFVEGYKDFMKDVHVQRQMNRYVEMFKQEGMSEDDAKKEARMLIVKNFWEDIRNMGVPILLKALWIQGGKGLLGFFTNNDDDDDKDKEEEDKNIEKTLDIIDMALIPTQGLPMTNIAMNVVEALEYGRKANVNPVFAFSELAQFGEDIVNAQKRYGILSPQIAGEVLYRVGRFGGVDLQTLSNIYIGVEGMARDEGEYKPWMVYAMYILNTPKSGRKDAARDIALGKSMAARLLRQDSDSFEEYVERVQTADGFLKRHPNLSKWLPWQREMQKVEGTEDEYRLPDKNNKQLLDEYEANERKKYQYKQDEYEEHQKKAEEVKTKKDTGIADYKSRLKTADYARNIVLDRKLDEYKPYYDEATEEYKKSTEAGKRYETLHPEAKKYEELKKIKNKIIGYHGNGNEFEKVDGFNEKMVAGEMSPDEAMKEITKLLDKIDELK